jgi:hypothetical protein
LGQNFAPFSRLVPQALQKAIAESPDRVEAEYIPTEQDFAAMRT